MRSTADPRVEVFAVEPSAAQLVVRARYDGDHALSVGTRTALVRVRDGVGAAVVERLEADTAYQVAIDGRPVTTLRTLPAPPGRFLGRFATVSDLHIGETGFGRAPRLHLSAEPDGAHPVVCLRAALTELREWGAEAVVVKGDLTHDSRAAEYDLAGGLLASCGLPLWVIPGNHDGGNHRHDDGGIFGRQRGGLEARAVPRARSHRSATNHARRRRIRHERLAREVHGLARASWRGFQRSRRVQGWSPADDHAERDP